MGGIPHAEAIDLVNGVAYCHDDYPAWNWTKVYSKDFKIEEFRIEDFKPDKKLYTKKKKLPKKKN